jgi:hypothetical protein
MMDTVCPQGHSSATTDYCDQCGTPIAVAHAPADEDVEVSSTTQVRTTAAPAEPCPRCGTPRTPGDRYCEVDGYDFEPRDLATAVWYALVEADRVRFEALDSADLEFPDDPVTCTYVLDAESVTVGRSSLARGISPDIDLGGPSEDPGVSRRHLRFDRLPDDTYAVVDCGSANGTTVNDDRTLLPPETRVPLADGDRVHLGAWTTIKIICRET